MLDPFTITVEVVPPAGPEADHLLATLTSLVDLPISGFSVATNPVARPRMNALALCALIQQRTGKPVTLHCTTRDHNRLSLQGLLWGAKALNIQTVLVMTGDFVALGERAQTTTVRDLNVFNLIALAREAGLRTGVVFEPVSTRTQQECAFHRLERKVAAGAQFLVTQPVYDPTQLAMLDELLKPAGIPVILGILPLISFRHAEFLHQRVAGIDVPSQLRERMAKASDPRAEGVMNARDMLAVARQHFAGACVMPPFDHYEMLWNIIS